MPSSNLIETRPRGGRIGAELHGIKLSGSMPDHERKTIWDALLRHKVIFFRKQSHLDDHEHEAFTRQFGEFSYPVTSNPDDPDRSPVVCIRETLSKGLTDSWHTDGAFGPRPHTASVLRMVQPPEQGGDTMWANTAEAFRRLPAELQTFAKTLTVIHSNERTFANSGTDQLGAQTFGGQHTATRHPLVTMHPETGEPCMLLGMTAQRIVGYDQWDSADLINLFQRHIIRPENVTRWTFAQGDVVIWDNRATQHYAVFDYDGFGREVRRVTLKGGIPLSAADQDQSKPELLHS